MGENAWLGPAFHFYVISMVLFLQGLSSLSTSEVLLLLSSSLYPAPASPYYNKCKKAFDYYVELKHKINSELNMPPLFRDICFYI